MKWVTGTSTDSRGLFKISALPFVENLYVYILKFEMSDSQPCYSDALFDVISGEGFPK